MNSGRLLPIALTVTAAIFAAGSASSAAGKAGVTRDERPFDFHFVDREHGWLLGWRHESEIGVARLFVRRTRDGGRTWSSATPLGQPFAIGNWDWPARQIRFGSLKDGWIYGPGLFSTHDGGKTWKDESRKGSILSLSPSGQTVWALHEKEAERGFDILESRVAGSAWKPLSGEIPATATWKPRDMVRRDPKFAWILGLEPWGSPPDGEESPHAEFAVSTDGGLSWSRRSSPCRLVAPPMSLAVEPGSRNGWLLCYASDGLSASGALSHSNDRGETWSPVTVTDYLPGVESFAVSKGRTWISGSRRYPEYSEDEGQTWKVLDLPDLPDDLDPYGFGSIQFVDERYGWLTFTDSYVHDRRWIFCTTDGGRTWTRSSWFQPPNS